MPWLLERIDYTWDRHRHSTGVSGDVRPSEFFARHIFGCFIVDETGIEIRHRIGIDNIMFESDDPRSDRNWPNSRKRLAEALLDVPDDEARKIVETNTRRVLNFFD